MHEIFPRLNLGDLRYITNSTRFILSCFRWYMITLDQRMWQNLSLSTTPQPLNKLFVEDTILAFRWKHWFNSIYGGHTLIKTLKLNLSYTTKDNVSVSNIICFKSVTHFIFVYIYIIFAVAEKQDFLHIYTLGIKG